MSFIANQPAKADELIIKNSPFWPDINPAEAREQMRLDGTVTPPRLRGALIEGIAFVNVKLGDWRKSQQAAGYAVLADIETEEIIDGQSDLTHRYFRAVFSQASAILQERLKNFDATGKAATTDAQRRSDEMARDLRRDAAWAINDIQGKTRVSVDLI